MVDVEIHLTWFNNDDDDEFLYHYIKGTNIRREWFILESCHSYRDCVFVCKIIHIGIDWDLTRLLRHL